VAHAANHGSKNSAWRESSRVAMKLNWAWRRNGEKRNNNQRKAKMWRKGGVIENQWRREKYQ